MQVDVKSLLFKFHCDSINIADKFIPIQFGDKFKFHCDSININRRIRYVGNENSFKFHCDSINILLLNPRKYPRQYLNSTVILLISVPIHYYFSLSFSTLFCRPLTFSQKFLIFLLILFHLFLHFLRSFNCRPPHIFTLSEVDNFFTAKIQFYPLPYQEILCLTIFPDGF